MYQTTIKCKGLRLIERHEGMPMTAEGSIRPVDPEAAYVEAHLESHENKANFYFSFPVELLDPAMRVGDEVIVTFQKKEG